MQGKGTADHMMPLGDWLPLYIRFPNYIVHVVCLGLKTKADLMHGTVAPSWPKSGKTYRPTDRQTDRQKDMKSHFVATKDCVSVD